MSLALLIVLVVVQYAPAPLKEVIRKYHSINHTLKKVIVVALSYYAENQQI